MDDSKFDIVKFFNQKNEIIRNEKVFEPNFIPECLIHREEELKLLATHFKSIISINSSNVGKQIVIQGPVGIGKTVLVKKFGETLEKYCSENLHSLTANIVFFHMN